MYPCSKYVCILRSKFDGNRFAQSSQTIRYCFISLVIKDQWQEEDHKLLFTSMKSLGVISHDGDKWHGQLY